MPKSMIHMYSLRDVLWLQSTCPQVFWPSQKMCPVWKIVETEDLELTSSRGYSEAKQLHRMQLTLKISCDGQKTSPPVKKGGESHVDKNIVNETPRGVTHVTGVELFPEEQGTQAPHWVPTAADTFTKTLSAHSVWL